MSLRFLDQSYQPIEERLANRRLVVFGAGRGGRILLRYLRSQGCPVDFICDNDPSLEGQFIDQVPVRSTACLADIGNGALVVIGSNWAQEIAAQLAQHHVQYLDLTTWDDRWRKNFDIDLIKGSREDLEEVSSYFRSESDRTLFHGLLLYRLSACPLSFKMSDFGFYNHPCVGVESGDIVFDVGCFDGKTALFFANLGAGQVHTFEPDAANAAASARAIGESEFSDNIVLHRFGFWSAEGTLSFSVDPLYQSQNRISGGGVDLISVRTIDSFVGETNLVPDLIKMDIEGAERAAIEGARETLVNCRPKLQISVYHEPDDLWRIPQLIRKIQPSYEFFLGHHSQNMFETVLYARANGADGR